MEVRPAETQITDSFSLINSNIEIDPALMKQIASRKDKHSDSPLNDAAARLGDKIGQISDLLKILFEKTKQIEKKIDFNESSSKVALN